MISRIRKLISSWQVYLAIGTTGCASAIIVLACFLCLHGRFPPMHVVVGQSLWGLLGVYLISKAKHLREDEEAKRLHKSMEAKWRSSENKEVVI